MTRTSSEPHGRKLSWRRYRTAYLFIAPALIYFALFFFLPIIDEFRLSFTTGFTKLTPVGGKNYVNIIHDSEVWHSFGITVIYAFSCLILSSAIGLLLALVLNQNFKGRTIARTAILTPYMTSVAIIGLMWRNILDSNTGILNAILSGLGLPQQNWLTTAPLATLVGITVWQESGYVMLLFLAGLQSIDPQLYEAARIDGASVSKQFWKITLPMLAPTTLFVVLVGMIGSLQQFGLPYIVTNGGPGNETSLYVYQVYRETFTSGNLGYASAMSFLLLVVIVALSMIQLRVGRKKEAIL
ncbi:sugar ABC transporter permease [Cutibacterium sp. WCA-380-WT-3A]|uniref:Sugar ABC transporter permease n=1 Tax=Cutibacterium porci TaxID=2605781 RepID=A0A7K0J465_9ACTN|nr:sugar ABC transporter permease [Cutibacterium porci]MSS44726.1 sugar ABC transporter permease [Cutibacterium porci]